MRRRHSSNESVNTTPENSPSTMSGDVGTNISRGCVMEERFRFPGAGRVSLTACPSEPSAVIKNANSSTSSCVPESRTICRVSEPPGTVQKQWMVNALPSEYFQSPPSW